jgi:universal stress protein A
LTTVKLEQVAKELGKQRGPVKTFLSTGVPAEEIVRVANQDSTDLIVMGTHGWSGVRHMLLGSVAEKILRSAPCPVLVVKPSEKDVSKA